jgi:hypothetical protein
MKDEGSYSYARDTYIHAIMGGEAIHLEKEGSEDIQYFQIYECISVP